MRHPPYHLRPNKAIDRLLFRELLQRVHAIQRLDEYVYYGMGGPFLDDMRMMAETFPRMQLVSIESNRETVKRQAFHTVCKNVQVINKTFAEFVDGEWPAGIDVTRPVIAWGDFTRLRATDLAAFERLVGVVPNGSIVKITLRADDLEEKSRDEVWREATSLLSEAYMPQPFEPDQYTGRAMATTVLSAMRIASEKGRQGGTARFRLLCGYVYSDGTRMASACGIICDEGLWREIRHGMRDWEYARLDWHHPLELTVPVLSMKERMHLEPLLPAPRGSGKALRKRLGYRVEDSESKNLAAMDAYRLLHRAYPLFGKISV